MMLQMKVLDLLYYCLFHGNIDKFRIVKLVSGHAGVIDFLLRLAHRLGLLLVKVEHLGCLE